MVRFFMLSVMATDVPATSFAERHDPCKASEIIDASDFGNVKEIYLVRTTMKKLLTLIKGLGSAMAPLGLILLFTNLSSAQGPIFTGDASNLSNIIRESLKLMAIILFCLGAVGVAWSIYNKMTGKEWGNQAFGSILSFAFGTIVAVFWQLAQGRSVGVDTNF